MASSLYGGGGRRLLFPMVAAAAVLVEAAAASVCYTRMFSFGDSLADTGNYRFFYSDDHSDPVLRLPYGETFFHRASGRFTDGRIVLDFIADALGLPFVPPYLSGRHAEAFLHGANFAVGRATALAPDFFRDRGFDVGDVVHLDMEVEWFRDMLSLLCPADLSGCSEMMNQSLFIVGEIGGNDYNLPLLERVPFQNVLTFAPAVIAKISSSITELIGLGAKTLVVPGNLPIGCIPAYLLAFQSDEKEDYEPGTGCIKWLNEFARYHNKLLIEELEKLRKLHPRVTIIYADYYGAAMEVFVSPQQYGIEYPLVACCGGGGRYGVSQDVRCGRGEFKDKRTFGHDALPGWPRHRNKGRPLDLEIDGAAVSSHVLYIPALTLDRPSASASSPSSSLSAAARAGTGRVRPREGAPSPGEGGQARRPGRCALRRRCATAR